jgi:ribose transport system substrate-binding protein
MLRRSAFAWLMCALALFVGCGKPTKKIILLNNTEDPFWDAARAGIKDAATELKLAEAGYEAMMESNQGGEVGQIQKLKQYATRSDIAAVIISPISGSNQAIADELKKLRDKGIIVGCFDSDLIPANHGSREFYVGTNNIKGGELLGAAAAALKPSGAEYVQFVGKDSQQNAIERMNGFKSAMGNAGTEQARMIDETDQLKARTNVRLAIDKYPTLNMLVGIWAYNAPAIALEVKEQNKRDKFTIVTFDADTKAIEYMGQGMIDAMVVQNPYNMGKYSVDYAYAKLTKNDAKLKELFPNMGQPGGDIRDTGLKVVIPDQGSPITKEALIKVFPAVELMPLSEFTAWLKKYNLKSS